MGIAELIIMAMEKEGLPREQCIKKIWMVDSKGLIVKVRSSLMTSYIYISVDIQTHRVVCIGIYTHSVMFIDCQWTLWGNILG